MEQRYVYPTPVHSDVYSRWVKRAELEAKLKALGWFPAGPSGRNHVKWAHAKKAYKLYVRQTAIIPSATAERILEEAGR